jgi:hypothetical protein
MDGFVVVDSTKKVDLYHWSDGTTIRVTIVRLYLNSNGENSESMRIIKLSESD